MLRRLHHEQPESFEFTPANLTWAQAQMTKYPEGRQQSAVIPLLWRAQEQEGWLSRPAIEYVADLLGMPYIRALEVATFYFMFQLSPVGRVAHIQICGTTTCMICGAEDLIAVCREKIAPEAHMLSADGNFSWEEVECLGACSNAPMAQIGKDYYEDLTAERLRSLIDEFSAGKVPVPGPQNGRWASEPMGDLTSLSSATGVREAHNGSVALAVGIGDTVRRIDGTEVPLLTPWQGKPGKPVSKDEPKGAVQGEAAPAKAAAKARKSRATAQEFEEMIEGAKDKAARKTAKKAEKKAAKADKAAAPAKAAGGTAVADGRPAGLKAARGGQPDDLKMIRGVGPKLEALLHSLGYFHFDQLAGWTESEVAWVDEHLEGFRGRATRDQWVSQARQLARGEETEFARKARKDGLYD